MSQNTSVLPVQTIEGDHSSLWEDTLAVEEPLQILLNGSPLSITMRTPGNDSDLAIGFLFTEGIVEDIAQIAAVRQEDENSVSVQLKPGVAIAPHHLQRNFYATSSCGVCGKASIQAIAATPRRTLSDSGPHFAPGVIHQLSDTVRQAQAVFDRTGGLHAAALFSSEGRLLELREDVGRHNAVDKVIGFALQANNLALADLLIFVSGRAGFELVQKALMAGIPALAAVGAPSSLAVETALQYDMTLLGFVRGERFNIYSGGWRIAAPIT